MKKYLVLCVLGLGLLGFFGPAVASAATSASFDFMINNTTGGFTYTVGDVWNLFVSGPSNTPFTFCVNHNNTQYPSCTPNFGTTSNFNGSWTLAGSFQPADVGSWVDTVTFNGASSSYQINFTVAATSSAPTAWQTASTLPGNTQTTVSCVMPRPPTEVMIEETCFTPDYQFYAIGAGQTSAPSYTPYYALVPTAAAYQTKLRQIVLPTAIINTSTITVVPINDLVWDSLDSFAKDLVVQDGLSLADVNMKNWEKNSQGVWVEISSEYTPVATTTTANPTETTTVTTITPATTTTALGTGAGISSYMTSIESALLNFHRDNPAVYSSTGGVVTGGPADNSPVAVVSGTGTGTGTGTTATQTLLSSLEQSLKGIQAGLAASQSTLSQDVVGNVTNVLASITQIIQTLVASGTSAPAPTSTSAAVVSGILTSVSSTPTLPATFRYIKINTTEDTGWISWREIEVYGPDGKLSIATSTVGPVPSYLLSSNPLYNSQGYGSVPSEAYDGNITTLWNGAFTSMNQNPSRCQVLPGPDFDHAYQDWITLDLGSPQTVTKVRMTPGGTTDNGTCGIHQILGSVDGMNFTLIKEFSGDFHSFQWLQYPADSQNPEVGPTLPVPNASFVSMVAPATVSPGQRFTSTLVMENTGQAAWTTQDPIGPFRLGISPQSPCGDIWGVSRVELPVNSVPPGATTTFVFSATAPTSSGGNMYSILDLQMVHENVEWFGDTSQNLITVQ
jgi:hypothetical protein